MLMSKLFSFPGPPNGEDVNSSRSQLIPEDEIAQPQNYRSLDDPQSHRKSSQASSKMSDSIRLNPTHPSESASIRVDDKISRDHHPRDMHEGDDGYEFHCHEFSMRCLLRTFLKICRQRNFIKFVIAFLYLFVVSFFLSCLMVIAHWRMPNNSTWRGELKALPDLILDGTSLHLWAFVLSEILINVMSTSCLILSIFHRHTWIVLRRTCCILATIFLLRAISVVVTSLPPPTWPYVPKGCQPIQLNSVADFLARAWRIFIGTGLKIQGGETCGDFVFSGHTSSLTTFNLIFITYAPWNVLFLLAKILTTIISGTGIIAILLSREHYTVDVILAMVISYYVFAEYHFVARYIQFKKSPTFNDPDQPTEYKRKTKQGCISCLLSPFPQTRYWRLKLLSPLTYYMECHGDGLIDNSLRIPCLKYCQRRKHSTDALPITSREVDKESP